MITFVSYDLLHKPEQVPQLPLDADLLSFCQYFHPTQAETVQNSSCMLQVHFTFIRLNSTTYNVLIWIRKDIVYFLDIKSTDVMFFMKICFCNSVQIRMSILPRYCFRGLFHENIWAVWRVNYSMDLGYGMIEHVQEKPVDCWNNKPGLTRACKVFPT